MAFFFFP
ncbi:bifunctional folylpolyglutamate synthase/dihydrofolate synthase, partial [Vibrio cholerae HC-56A1]